MKKTIVLVSVLSLALGLLTGCGKAASAEPSTTTEKVDSTNSSVQDSTKEETAANAETISADILGEDKVFTVGFDAEFPPYGYRDESGEYVGFDLDLAAEVCARNGWELAKQPIDWDAKDMELSSGAIDCIWNGFTMNAREDLYTWTQPYVDNSQVFVVAADSGIVTKADLAGKVVAVQKDSSALAALKNEENSELLGSFKELIEYADYNTAFMDLEQGAVDTAAIDVGVADYQIASREAGAYVMLEEKLATEQYGVGFLLGNEALRDAVQNTLNEMAEDGKFLEIATKWGLEDSVCLGK